MGLYKNSDLLQGSLTQKEVEMTKLKAKAYGYDINKKLEYQQQRVKPYGNTGHYNEGDDGLWENENKINSNLKLDQLAKDKQLWIGNPTQNIDKLMNDMDKNHVGNNSNYDENVNHPGGYYNNISSNSNLNSNLRKYSPLILDQQQQQINNKQNYSYKNKY